MFFDEATQRLVVVVRCFRNSNEVLGVDHSHRDFCRYGLVRVWEEQGNHAEVTLRDPSGLLDLCEVFTEKEASEGKHKLPWKEGERREGWSFVCSGFTKRKRGSHTYDLVHRRRPWRRAGGPNENFPDMRAPEVNHNIGRLPFISLPISLYVDDFNVWGMTNAVSGGFVVRMIQDYNLWVKKERDKLTTSLHQ